VRFDGRPLILQQAGLRGDDLQIVRESVPILDRRDVQRLLGGRRRPVDDLRFGGQDA
jgi:hypothetical protein